MTQAKYNTGRVVWRELITTNVEDAKGFYGELFNWSIEAVPMGPITYYMLKAGERHVGGLVDHGQGVPTHWMSYVSATDVDGAAKRATAAGGAILAGPDTMGPGRYAIVRDPSGAAIALWHAAEGDGDLPEKPGLGEFCWDELVTVDASKVEGFYRDVFGWEMGNFDPKGEIKVFKLGEQPAGGLNTQAPAGTPSHWLNYVVVDELGATRERGRKLGATVLLEEVPVADFGKIAILRDPQNAVIGLFEDVRK
jgi:hypothetical protein